MCFSETNCGNNQILNCDSLYFLNHFQTFFLTQNTEYHLTLCFGIGSHTRACKQETSKASYQIDGGPVTTAVLSSLWAIQSHWDKITQTGPQKTDKKWALWEGSSRRPPPQPQSKGSGTVTISASPRLLLGYFLREKIKYFHYTFLKYYFK